MWVGTGGLVGNAHVEEEELVERSEECEDREDSEEITTDDGLITHGDAKAVDVELLAITGSSHGSVDPDVTHKDGPPLCHRSHSAPLLLNSLGVSCMGNLPCMELYSSGPK
jgi:hypothetical protein